MGTLGDKLSTSSVIKTIKYHEVARYIVILSILCFATSLIFCLNDFPAGSDIPAHYIKIMNMQSMLREGNMVRWSPDWYSGYSMFGTYPPLIYIFAAALSLVINNIPFIMKMFIIVSFSSYPILLYRLGRVLGRTPKGATSMAILFSLTPLNVFFLFNGYFVLIISLALIFIFLAEFFKYTQNRDRTSFFTATALLAIISLMYHRALYFTLFIMFFYLLLKLYRRQLEEAAPIGLMIALGVGITSIWLLPAIVDMLTSHSAELFQSLLQVATHNGVSFQMIALLFIVPYCYLVFKKIRAKGIKDDRELALLISLAFFALLALGPYGILHYIVPFSSSQRVEITLLIVTFIATALASNLFDKGIKDGSRTFKGILLSSLLTLTMIIGVFFYPQTALSLEAINFTYTREEVNDSLTNLVTNAYVEQQVFLGKNDEDFFEALRWLSKDERNGRVAFYSNRSQAVDMFYYYAMLPASGKSTPQGIAPDGEGDLKWSSYTQHIIWYANETLLELSGTRWIISNYPIAFECNYTYKIFGEYRLYDLSPAKTLNGYEDYLYNGVGKIWVDPGPGCKNITIIESYHPRWRAFDQDNNEVKIESTEYGFIRITSTNTMEEIQLIFSDTPVDMIGKVISAISLIFFVALLISPKIRLRRVLH